MFRLFSIPRCEFCGDSDEWIRGLTGDEALLLCGWQVKTFVFHRHPVTLYLSHILEQTYSLWINRWFLKTPTTALRRIVDRVQISQ